MGERTVALEEKIWEKGDGTGPGAFLVLWQEERAQSGLALGLWK